ncbi:MAG: FAD-dependent oxidoreductase [Deltaproteobacteria bacterium]|jgi:pyruvate/2-oxoglutarate dehydrogenase complex dihydrolipoamide dehydrogenase (E3) component|nr:FAD-dependent oxidoreductase [Deltaproteobacteria bacterium]
MANFDYDIGVIGGGAAGLTVTSGSAQLGAKTLLIEKEKELGGDCLHFGCVPSKTLIKTAHVYHMMKTAEKYGLPNVDVPSVDFKTISNRIKSVIDVIQRHDSEERFCNLGAKVEFGEPVFVDEHSVRLNGKTVSAKSWVIATGSSPFVPPIEGLDTIDYITNKEIFYLDSLPKSMIIFGGGPIGSEMGQAFNRLGTKVYIVDRSDQILGKEDKDMADTVKQVMESEGVVFHLNTSIEAVKNIDRVKEVILKDKEGRTIRLNADAILVAVGRTPNIHGLGLDDIGIKLNRTGIEVDRRLRTNHKHIYAAGDVNGGYQFTHAAGYEGGIVVSNAIFRLPRKTDYTYLPWCTYTDPELASIGMNERSARAAGIDYSIWIEAFKDNDRSLAEGEKVGKIKMLLDEREKPIGIQIVGPHAGDLVSEWVAILNGKVKLSTLAAAVHPYPTIGEINKKVAGTYFTPKIFSDKIKKGLKFFFNLKGRACGPETCEE